MTAADHLTFAENLRAIQGEERPTSPFGLTPLSFEEVQAAASIWGALVLLMRRPPQYWESTHEGEEA